MPFAVRGRGSQVRGVLPEFRPYVRQMEASKDASDMMKLFRIDPA